MNKSLPSYKLLALSCTYWQNLFPDFDHLTRSIRKRFPEQPLPTNTDFGLSKSSPLYWLAGCGAGLFPSPPRDGKDPTWECLYTKQILSSVSSLDTGGVGFPKSWSCRLQSMCLLAIPSLLWKQVDPPRILPGTRFSSLSLFRHLFFFLHYFRDLYTGTQGGGGRMSTPWLCKAHQKCGKKIYNSRLL